MTDYVKPPRRSYRSPVRDARARATRGRVLDCAAIRFARDGYRATRVEAIAADAEVSAKTVYLLFGSKAGLLKQIMDVAFVADDEAIPLLERAGPQQVKAEPDQRRQIEISARGTAELLERIRQIDDVLTEAAAVDPDAAALRDDIELRQRREAMRVLAGWFSETGPLRDGMTVDHAADILWVLTSPEVHRLYRKHCSWSADQYTDWLTTAILDGVAETPPADAGPGPTRSSPPGSPHTGTSKPRR
jgi:AcrR family transcriptional regulator